MRPADGRNSASPVRPETPAVRPAGQQAAHARRIVGEQAVIRRRPAGDDLSRREEARQRQLGSAWRAARDPRCPTRVRCRQQARSAAAWRASQSASPRRAHRVARSRLPDARRRERPGFPRRAVAKAAATFMHDVAESPGDGGVTGESGEHARSFRSTAPAIRAARDARHIGTGEFDQRRAEALQDPAHGAVAVKTIQR